MSHPLILLLLMALAFPAGAATVAVRDDSGGLIALKQPATRIVTLSPHATELVFAAGAGARLVAVAPYSDHPAAALGLPTIGGLGGLDRERLLALAPDLVVAWQSGNRSADLAWLADQDIAVYLSEPRHLDDIARNLRDLGRLAGTSDRGDEAAQRFLSQLARACPPRAETPTAFIRLGQRPLLTVGGGHWLDHAIRAAGLRNVYRDLPARALTVSEESLLQRQPALVLYLDYPGATAPTGVDSIGLDPALWGRPGPRLAQGIARLCHRLGGMHNANSATHSKDRR